jgi:hypothetical protein
MFDISYKFHYHAKKEPEFLNDKYDYLHILSFAGAKNNRYIVNK